MIIIIIKKYLKCQQNIERKSKFNVKMSTRSIRGILSFIAPTISNTRELHRLYTNCMQISILRLKSVSF